MSLLDSYLNEYENHIDEYETHFEDVVVDAFKNKNERFFNMFEIDYSSFVEIYRSIAHLKIDEYIKMVDFLPFVLKNALLVFRINSLPLSLYDDIRRNVVDVIEISKKMKSFAIKNALLLECIAYIKDDEAKIFNLFILRDEARQLLQLKFMKDHLNRMIDSKYFI